MLMYQWWLFSWLAFVRNLSAVEKELTEMRENLGQKNLVNATLHLIISDRFQKMNTQD